MRRKRSAAVIALMLVGAAFLVPAASATTACQDSQMHHWFDGMDARDPSSTTTGVWGYIRDRPIATCGSTVGDTSGASIWVMLTPGQIAPEYAQAGYLKIAGWNAPLAFEEYNDGSDEHPGWQAYYFGSIWSSGTAHSYKVDDSSVTNKIYIYIDGVQRFSPPWDPELVWATPWIAEYDAETYDRGDDVPGTLNSKVDYSILRAKYCTTCAWVAPHGATVSSDFSYYKVLWNSAPTSFWVWTQR
jgi:hypothetical protein